MAEDEQITQDTKLDISAPVERLIFFLENPTNIAEFLDDNTLAKIGDEAVKGYEVDEDSMQDWVDVIEKGLDLIKPELHPKNEPWPDAANFKSPMIMDASIRLGDRASAVLLQNENLVKPKTIGKDKDKQKLKRAQRTSTYMNWQLNNEIKDWVPNHERLLYDIPLTGQAFKKIFYSREEQSIVSEILVFPNFVVNHNITSLERAPRFSHNMEFLKNEVIEKQRAGIWLDIPLDTDDAEDINEEEQDSNPNLFVEQQTFIDLDDDGYKEPYTVTFHKASAKVLRIVPRFNVNNIFVSNRSAPNKVSSLTEVIRDPLFEALEDLEIVKITPIQDIVDYGLIPNPDGGFLDVGYIHLLCGFNAGVNVTTNSLLNAGSLANAQGGFIARNGRQQLGVKRIKPGVYQQTDIDAKDLQNSFRDYTFKEPSPTLFQLNQFMIQTAKELSSSVDIASAIGANAPAATTLALIQDQQQGSGAIIKRIYRAETQEFKKIFDLNAETLNFDQYVEVLDDEEASREDFLGKFDIVPAANPEASSQVQKLQLAQVEMAGLEAVQQAGGNIQPIVKSFYEAIGSQNIDEIFPEPTEEDQLRALQLQEAQIAAQEKQIAFNNDIVQRQVNVLERKQGVEEAKAIANISKIEAEIEKTESEIDKNEADTIKTIEEAQTESLNNTQATIQTNNQL